MLKETVFHAKDCALNYGEGSPSGPPLVLIHGIASRWQVFLPILPSLCEDWHVFALDLRGHGSSDRVPGSYALKRYVSDVVAFVTSSVVEPCVLLGHSMGGSIALLVAGAIPDLVSGVIAGDTPLMPDQGMVPRRLRRLAVHLRLLRPLAGRPVSEILNRLPARSESNTELAESLHRTDPEVIDFVCHGRMSKFGAGTNWERTLSRVSCPVLLLRASSASGAIATADDIDYGLSILPNARHALLREAGHDLGLLTGKSEDLLSATLDFLELLHDAESRDPHVS